MAISDWPATARNQKPERSVGRQSESRKKMDNPFDCLSDDYQTRVEEKAAAEAIMATKVRLQVQF